MAFPNEDIAQFPIKLFHLLRNDQPNENILISPLNLSAALHLLYSARRNSTGQTEMTPTSSQDNECISSESRPHSEAPAGCNASEASHAGLFTQDSCGVEEALVMSNAPEALHKAVVENCEACAANKKPAVPASLPASERDAREMGSNLGHVFTPNGDENVASSFLPEAKDITKHEAVKVLSDKMTSSKDIAPCPLPCNPEKQKRSFEQGTVAAEEIRLSSFYSIKTDEKGPCNTSFQPGESTVNQVVCGDIEAKLGSPSLVSIPTSEEDNRASAIEDRCVEATASKNSQSSAEDTALHLLRTYNDEVLLNQEKPSLEGKVHHNQPTNTKMSQEGLSQTGSVAVSDTLSPLPDPLTEGAAGNVQKTPVPELSCNMDSMKSKDCGTESAISPPFASLSSEINDGQVCMNLIQITEDNSLRLETNKDISLDFLPLSDFPRNDEKVVVSQEASPGEKALDSQITPPDPQTESFLNHTEAPNTSSSSVVDGASRTTLNDIVSREELKCSVDQKKGASSAADERVSHLVLPSNDGLMDRQFQSSWDYKVKHWLNQSVFELGSSSYDLPWNKYLIGREQREALMQSRYILQRKYFENRNVLFQSRRSKRHAWIQNLPFAPRLTVQSYTGLLRSNSH